MPLKGLRLLLVGIGLLVPSATLAQQYTLTILGGGIYTWANAINAQGQVVGESRGRAFMWTDGSLHDLGLLPGTNSCRAYAINDGGQVVGSCSGVGVHPAFLWTAETGITALPIPSPSEARGINNQGHIVGKHGDPVHAFLYRDGVVEDLGPGRALGINDQDQVVGYGDGADQYRRVARLWDEAGPHDLDDEASGDGDSIAWAINAAGLVAGSSTRGWTPYGGPLHAVLWTPDGVSDLGTLGGSPGSDSSQALAISGDLIVGTTNSRAFIYDTNGPGYPANLNDPASGWRLYAANGINAAGQIVGSGDCCGDTHAFLLTPVRPLTPR
jgi:probable HAF family extracellular repeat protein